MKIDLKTKDQIKQNKHSMSTMILAQLFSPTKNEKYEPANQHHHLPNTPSSFNYKKIFIFQIHSKFDVFR
jgi:hypothetical protein